jgi:hypothetical protein
LVCIGNLKKVEVAKGGEAMRTEIDSKLPTLKEPGNYIPGVDHFVHVDFTLERFNDYRDYLSTHLAF